MIQKKKLPKYGFGSTLQAVSPFLNLIPGVGQVASIAAGTIGGIINNEEQAKEAAKKNIKYTPMDISTNPYGKLMEGGGEPPGSKKTGSKYSSKISQEIQQNDIPTAGDSFLSTAGKLKNLAKAKSGDKLIKAGGLVSALTSIGYAADGNYLKAGANAVPFLNETLDTVIPGWDSKEANEGIAKNISKVPEAMKFLKDKVSSMVKFENGGDIQVGNSKQYNAPTHANGGQPINSEGEIDYKNPSAEIEGSENKYKYSKVDNKSYVFSDKNGTSELIRNIFDKYKNKKTDSDFTTKAAMEMEIKKVEGLNEKINQIRETQEPKQEEQTETQEEPQMEGGGGLNVITMRKEQANQKRLFKLGDGGVPDGTPYQLGLNNTAYQGQPMYENPSPFKLRIQNQLPTLSNYTSNQPNINSSDLPSYQTPVTNRSSAPLNFTMPKMNITNGNVADVLKGGLALYDVAKAANAKPEIVDPRLADYNKADNQLYSQHVDLTSAKNQAQAAANQGYSQVNDASMSNSTRMARLQGVNSNLQANAGNLALQAQGMKNAINQNLGQYEGNKAVDNANRLSIADEKNAMNRAATRSASESAKQTIGSYAQDFVAKMNRDNQIKDVTNAAKLKTAEGFALLKATVNNFELDGSKEWQDYSSNPNDANLEKLTKAMKIKFK